jgi:hypothetical protein
MSVGVRTTMPWAVQLLLLTPQCLSLAGSSSSVQQRPCTVLIFQPKAFGRYRFIRVMLCRSNKIKQATRAEDSQMISKTDLVQTGSSRNCQQLLGTTDFFREVYSGRLVVAASKVPRLAMRPVHLSQQQLTVMATDQAFSQRARLQLTARPKLLSHSRPSLECQASYPFNKCSEGDEHACQAGQFRVGVVAEWGMLQCCRIGTMVL